jgi:CRISPR system Cascade subunit CasE
MNLSRIFLNPASSEVWPWVRSPLVMHGALWRLFPGVERVPDARSRARILHRLTVERDGRLTLLVQSKAEPDWSGWPRAVFAAPPEVKSLAPVLEAVGTGQRFRFRLVGNVVKSVSRSTRRVALRGDDALKAWLARAGARSGFEVESALAAPCSREEWWSGPSPSHVEHPVCFDGVLRVVDTGTMRKALENGIGRGKSYGCGLLLVARAAA